MQQHPILVLLRRARGQGVSRKGGKHGGGEGMVKIPVLCCWGCSFIPPCSCWDTWARGYRSREARKWRILGKRDGGGEEMVKTPMLWC